MLREVDITENHSSIEAMKRHPGSVLSLISALRFHDIGTQIPHAIWLMRQDRKELNSLFIPWKLDDQRTTMDLDLLGFGSPDVDNLAQVFKRICRKIVSNANGLKITKTVRADSFGLG